MSELADLLHAKAEIEAKIEAIKASEVDRLKLQLVDVATQLRELNALPPAVRDLFTDKVGTFNAYRAMRIKKPA